jgi:hypothetical protein
MPAAAERIHGLANATRRIDQLRLAQKETIGLATCGDAMKARVGEKPEVEHPTLASQGIDKNLAHQARAIFGLDLDSRQRAPFNIHDVEQVVTTPWSQLVQTAKH